MTSDSLPAADDLLDAAEPTAGTDVAGAAPTSGIPPEVDDGLDYWQISRTPLTSLVFTLPLVLAYEGGVLLLGRGSPRNGADVWLRQLLDSLGFGSYFLLPALTVVGLLAWHHVAHDRWRCSWGILVGMVLESLFWAGVLVGLARLQEGLWPLAAGLPDEGALRRLIGYCGAGLYEEVLFRLLLLPGLVWLAGRLGMGDAGAALTGLLASSVLFSLAHYVGPLGDHFDWYGFTFRTVAGAFFAGLFLLRGFGIAAGTHAAYDMFVGLL